MGQPGPLLGPTYDRPGKDLWDRGDAAYTLYVSSIQRTRRPPSWSLTGFETKQTVERFLFSCISTSKFLGPLKAVSIAVQAALRVLDDQRT